MMRISKNFSRQKPGNGVVTDETECRKLFLDIPKKWPAMRRELICL